MKPKNLFATSRILSLSTLAVAIVCVIIPLAASKPLVIPSKVIAIVVVACVAAPLVLTSQMLREYRPNLNYPAISFSHDALGWLITIMSVLATLIIVGPMAASNESVDLNGPLTFVAGLTLSGIHIAQRIFILSWLAGYDENWKKLA